MSRARVIRSVSLLALSLAAPLGAQTVQGRVLEREGETPVRDAVVQLLPADERDDRVIARSATDSLGGFSLQAPAPGRYRLAAALPGRPPVRTEPIAVGDAGADLELRLGARAVRLPGLTVSVRRRDDPRLLGFYQRSDRGSGGYFLQREDILKRRPVRVGDLLQTVPGLVVKTSPTNPAVPQVELRSAGRCPVLFFLDGMRVSNLDLGTVQPGDLEGVEVYVHGGTIPAEFNSRMGSSCGVIALWTRI